MRLLHPQAVARQAVGAAFHRLRVFDAPLFAAALDAPGGVTLDQPPRLVLAVVKNILNFAFGLLGMGADVVTVTTGTAGNSGNVAADLQTYFSAKLLEVAELNTILDQFGEKAPVPSNSSKTIQFVREEKFSTSTTPTQLTEGLPPDAVGLTLNQFDAIMEQYGFLTRISDLAELTAL